MNFKKSITSIVLSSSIVLSYALPIYSASNSVSDITEIRYIRDPFGNDFIFKIIPDSTITKVKKLYVDGIEFNRVTSKYLVWGTSKNFYQDESNGQIYILRPTSDSIFKLLGDSDENLGEFLFKKDSNKFEKIATTVNPSPIHDKIPVNSANEENNGDSSTRVDSINIDSLTSLIEREKDFAFDPYSISVRPAEAINNINSISIGTKQLKSMSSKASVFGDNYYIDKVNNIIYLGDTVRTGSVIIFKNGNTELAKFKKTSSGYEKINDNAISRKKLYVRLKGAFEAAIVSQKKYDAVSSATGSASTNKNSNVVIEVSEKEGDTKPAENEWRLIKDASDIHIDTNNSHLNINDDSMGMAAVYNSYDSAITLSGTPNKAGKFTVSATVRDNLGREAISNALPFNVYDLNEVKLSDQLLEKNFVDLPHGRKKKWDMEPWIIEKFDRDNKSDGSEIIVPNSLKLWNGSNESGVYGVLGYPVNQDAKPHQTLVIGNGTNLTLRNMKILSSVNILVKDGGKLNFYDSSLYGTITVENGGRFQMNYDDFSNSYLTGSSINGKLILKDGAILESSIIYSNANHLTDGKVARTIDSPVVDVEGLVNISGNVFIRGDDSATGNKSDGSLYTGQPALKLKESARLSIPEGSLLGCYGGGQWATTSIGGGAIILEENSNIMGDGKLIAIGGSGRALKGGDALSGSGKISVKSAYLQGGDNYSESTPTGLAFTKNISISDKTLGYAKNGKHNPSNYDLEHSPYWKGLKAPGVDKTIVNPLDYSSTQDAPKINKTSSNENNTDDNSNVNDTINKDNSSDINKSNKKNDEKNINRRKYIYIQKNIYGKDRIETSVLLSKYAFDKSETVFLVSSKNPIDALIASGLSGTKSPILYSSVFKADSIILKEIERLGAKNIIVIGGQDSISDSVLSYLDKLKYNVNRISGIDRYDSSLKLANSILSENNKGKIILASGENISDALTISPYAAKNSTPIILINKNNRSKQLSDLIKKYDIKTVDIIGGKNSVSDTMERDLSNLDKALVVNRMYGKNRFETSEKIANKYFSNSENLFFTNPKNNVDTYILGPIAARYNSPILFYKNSKDLKSEKNNILVGGELAKESLK